MRTLQEWMGHRDFETTLIYADYSPDDRRERDLIARAVKRRWSKLGSNLSETESNSTRQTELSRGRKHEQHRLPVVVVQAVGGSSPLAHPR
jgi:hypothetical protein